MKHYDYVEWIFYKTKSLSKYKMTEMEKHLFQCESCMNIFLSLIDEIEIEKTDPVIPDNFNFNVLNRIKNVRSINKKERRKGDINNIFIYYTAVASVAIILTAGGLFTTLVESIPKVSANIITGEEINKGSRIYDFSETIVNKTSIFINDFQVKKGRIENETKK